jgi:hypothetical protein
MKRLLIILVIFVPFLMAAPAVGIEKEKAPKESAGMNQPEKEKSREKQERPSPRSESDRKIIERQAYDEFIDKNGDGIDDRVAPRKSPQKDEQPQVDEPVETSPSSKDSSASGKSSDDNVVRRKNR